MGRIAAVAVCLAILAGWAVMAQDVAVKAEVITVTGKVSVVKADDGNVTAITITDKDAKASNVMLDAKGKKLAEMDGKEVVAKGVEVTKDDAKWFKVASFKEVKAKVEAPAAE